MKWMIASDLHGSAKYCRQMVEAFEREGADRLLLLGDLLYHGPRNDLPDGYAPKEVIPLLNGLKPKLCCVRGNCEAEVDQMVLSFPVMADYCILPVGKSWSTPHTATFIIRRTCRRWHRGCAIARPHSRPGVGELWRREPLPEPRLAEHPEGE